MELRERITIENRAGGSKHYTYDGAAWAGVKELIPADLTATNKPHWQVTMRERDGIGPQSRFIWRGRFLAVRSVAVHKSEPNLMVVQCEERG